LTGISLVALIVYLVVILLAAIFNAIVAFHIRRYTDKTNVTRKIFFVVLLAMSIAVVLPFLFLNY